MGEDGVQQGSNLLGRRGELRFEAGDVLLGFVALDLAFEGDPSGNGFGGLGPGPVRERALDDRLEGLDGRLGQALLHGLLDPLPLALAGRRRVESDRDHHQSQNHPELLHTSRTVQPYSLLTRNPTED